MIVHIAVECLCLYADFIVGEGGKDLNPLCIAQCLGVVAVCVYVTAAHEGGTVGDVRLASSWCDAGVGGIKRIVDIDGVAIIPANKAAALGSAIVGEQTAIIDTF